MTRFKTASLVMFPVAVLSGVLYASFAYVSIKGGLSYDPNVGFGPHSMPWPRAGLLALRALFGIVFVVSSFLALRGKWAWFKVVFASLLVINAHNLYTLVSFSADAQSVGAGVLAFFPLAMLVDYALHFLFLLASIFVLIRHPARAN